MASTSQAVCRKCLGRGGDVGKAATLSPVSKSWASEIIRTYCFLHGCEGAASPL